MLADATPKECELIQPAPPRVQAATPLFLLHDGGGTTFAYHCLAPLGRAVFGVANPRFHSGTPWEGGVPEMARAYLRMIRRTAASATAGFPALAPSSVSYDDRGRRRRRRRILLGGWSLGGLLSLEIARLLVTGANDDGVDEERDADDGVEIVGLVMIDSVRPVWPAGSSLRIAKWVEPEEPEGKNLKLARRAMKLAGGMVKVWKMPRCGAAPAVPVANGPTKSAEGQEEEGLEKSFYGSREERETAAAVWQRPPRAVLVRARDRVPVPEGTEEISPVDVYRDDESLGWEGYCPGFVERSLEVQGNHFDMFAWGYIDGITAQVAEACRILEGTNW